MARPRYASARELASCPAVYELHRLCWPLLQTWCGGQHPSYPGQDGSICPHWQVQELLWGQVSPGAQKPWVIVWLRADEIHDFGHTISPRISFLAFKLRTVILPYSLHRLVVGIKDKGHEKTLHAYSVICMQVICFIIFAWVRVFEIDHIQEVTFWWRYCLGGPASLTGRSIGLEARSMWVQSQTVN